MKHGYKLKILTANDLFEGDVVYLTDKGEWSTEIAEARIVEDPESEQQLLVEMASQQHIIGPNAIEVSLGEAGVPEPTHFRERFRATGPSNYFHGKQAEQAV